MSPAPNGGSRRAELLGIAARLFAERGFKNTTVRDIADAAGILSGSLYHHFDSKESMVDELLDTFQTDAVEAVRRDLGLRAIAPRQARGGRPGFVRRDRPPPQRGGDLPERRLPT